MRLSVASYECNFRLTSMIKYVLPLDLNHESVWILLQQPTNFNRTVFKFYHINLSGFWKRFSVLFLIFYTLRIPIWSFWDLIHLNSLFFLSNLNAETKKNLKNMSPNFLLKLRVQSISENYFVRISFGTGWLDHM